MEFHGVSVFVPVYNEERILERNIVAINRVLSVLFKDYELVIVDDGSHDNTPAVGKAMAKANPHVKYCYFGNGPSRRENLGVAMRNSAYGIVCFMDVDLATDMSYLAMLVQSVQDGADVAIGSRYKGVRSERTWFRRVVSGVYNRFMQLYFGSRVSDHQCGFKAFRKAALVELLEEMGYDNSLSRGWFWDAELLIRAQKKGFKIVEFPVQWRFGEKSSFRISQEIRMIPYVLKLRWRI